MVRKKKEKVKLSIIIVNYKSDQYLKKCLESIGLNESWETIVQDNSQNNIGYGGGCNLGAKKAKGEFLLFLNPDTIVLPGTLKKMISFMEMDKEKKIGVLGPRIYNNFKKEKQLSFCHFPNLLSFFFVYSPIKSFFPNNPFWNHHIYRKLLNTKKPIEVEAVSGAALMIRRDVFKKIGGFDKNFFLYFEENDLCRRVQKIGKKVVFFPKAQIIHFGRKSTFDLNKANKDFQLSRFYFLKKHFGAVSAIIVEGIIRFFERMAELI